MITFNPDIVSLSKDQMNHPLIYSWNFGTGNAADTSNNPIPTFDYVQPGTYTVTLQAQSFYGCSKQATATVVGVMRSKGTITGPQSICEDSTVLFNGTATIINNSTTWQWDFGNSKQSVLQNPPMQTFNDSGIYNISFIVTNNGCQDTSYSKLIVHSKPIINLTPKQPNICFGKSIELDAHSGTVYSWTPDSNLSSDSSAYTIASPSVTTNLFSNCYQ
ncbi:MAG: PKD domain-containing protein [Ferruginibacter sp.]